jgi:hypothetical protein
MNSVLFKGILPSILVISTTASLMLKARSDVKFDNEISHSIVHSRNK